MSSCLGTDQQLACATSAVPQQQLAHSKTEQSTPFLTGSNSSSASPPSRATTSTWLHTHRVGLDGDCCSNSSDIIEALHQIPPVSHQDAEALSDEFGSCNSSWSHQAQSLVGIKINYDITPCSSTLSSLHPLCRICHNSSEKNNILITPCRCDGTLKCVHGTCLRKWIEIRSRRGQYKFPCSCELCGYMYRKRKFVKCTEWRLPRMNTRDKILHTVFLFSLVIMIACAVVTIQCLIANAADGGANKYRLPNKGKLYLSLAELVTLSCGIIFFITFITAMTVEIKAKHTIYEIIRKIVRYNTVWLIENYDRRFDTQLMTS